MLTEVKTFRCANCGEYINSSMTECKFCNHTVEAQNLAQLADVQDRVNAACSHASLTRSFAATLILSFFMSWLPFVGLFFGVVYLITLIVVPQQLVRWFLNYRDLRTSDPDYKAAQRNITFANVAWGVMFSITVLQIVLNF